MPRLSDTIGRLVGQRMADAMTNAHGEDRLSDLTDFGPNPGNLRARVYVPAQLQPRPALVVVLHGCTQTAAGYDSGAGWSQLADEAGFVLLFPEQRRANNPNLCFNWFAPEDMAGGHGEVASIRAMIAAMVAAHGIDPSRVFVTGLSAGGAMAAAMLANYPEVFAGGAVIGGLPYGTAQGVSQALERMRGRDLPDAAALTAAVRGASRHDGPWPTLSVWHGGTDATVHPANAEALLSQWRGLFGIGETPAEETLVGGNPHRVWRDRHGRAVIEDHRILAMGHGTPIATQGAEAAGQAGPFMLDVGLSSTRRIAAFWGIARAVGAAQAHAADAGGARDGGVAGIVNDALRAAGLLR